jgi:hypothetical protein
MLRKSLFWGLTLVLLVALVNLIIRGRRLEKQHATQLVEVVQNSEPSPTRVFAPQDLEVVNSSMTPEGNAARHALEIRNNGKLPYQGIQLRFSYYGKDGKMLMSKSWLIVETVLPGSTVKIDNIRIEEVSAATKTSQAAIVYADIGGTRPVPR